MACSPATGPRLTCLPLGAGAGKGAPQGERERDGCVTLCLLHPAGPIPPWSGPCQLGAASGRARGWRKDRGAVHKTCACVRAQGSPDVALAGRGPLHGHVLFAGRRRRVSSVPRARHSRDRIAGRAALEKKQLSAPTIRLRRAILKKLQFNSRDRIAERAPCHQSMRQLPARVLFAGRRRRP